MEYEELEKWEREGPVKSQLEPTGGKKLLRSRSLLEAGRGYYQLKIGINNNDVSITFNATHQSLSLSSGGVRRGINSNNYVLYSHAVSQECSKHIEHLNIWK